MVQQLRDEPSLPAETLIGIFGGLMNLWIGISFVTLFEVIEMLLLFCCPDKAAAVIGNMCVHAQCVCVVRFVMWTQWENKKSKLKVLTQNNIDTSMGLMLVSIMSIFWCRYHMMGNHVNWCWFAGPVANDEGQQAKVLRKM